MRVGRRRDKKLFLQVSMPLNYHRCPTVAAFLIKLRIFLSEKSKPPFFRNCWGYIVPLLSRRVTFPPAAEGTSRGRGGIHLSDLIVDIGYYYYAG